MPTQDEIDDVLAKTADYQQKKVISDEAQRVAQSASDCALSARQAWDAQIVDGETDVPKLTTLLEVVISTGQESNAKQEDAQAKSADTSQAQSAMNDRINSIINSEPTEPAH